MTTDSPPPSPNQLSQLPRFKTKGGLEIPSVDSATLIAMRRELTELSGISLLQTSEAAGYSMAMVVRYALGLSAQEGQVCVMASDNLSGLVALATLRHLVNGGAAGAALISGAPTARSPELQAQLRALTAMGVPIEELEPLCTEGYLERILADCHNVLWGASDITANAVPHLAGIVDVLNEGRTPVHAIELPAGMDPDTGKTIGTGLFASSTLSLGLPLAGLSGGRDRVGRHYVCDVSFSKEIFARAGVAWTPLFAEQPVVQIFPVDS
jgi:NAD(P)H-hydrate repair Nnr-like enzyme with NAD(P)H-hydrate epimerase domain